MHIRKIPADCRTTACPTHLSLFLCTVRAGQLYQPTADEHYHQPPHNNELYNIRRRLFLPVSEALSEKLGPGVADPLEFFLSDRLCLSIFRQLRRDAQHAQIRQPCQTNQVQASRQNGASFVIMVPRPPSSVLCFVFCFFSQQDPREKLIMSLKREVKVLRQENLYLRQQVWCLSTTA